MSANKLLNQIRSNSGVIHSKLESIQSLLGSVSGAERHQLSEARIQQEKEVLRRENRALEEEVKRLVEQLNSLEIQRKGVPEPLFEPQSVPTPVRLEKDGKNAAAGDKLDQVKPTVVSEENRPPQEKKEKQPKKASSEGKAKPKGAEDDKPIDVSRLDLRVGRIIEAMKHPDADSLYVEQVDVGEEKPRTVVSGLVKFVPLEQMQNRLALLMCNLKPAKMRGILSEAMVMCASTPEKVEILVPPEGALPGDRVAFDSYPGEPDAQLNPKKKIWEQVAPDLKTDADCVATYKGVAFTVPGKGVVKAPTLANVQIK